MSCRGGDVDAGLLSFLKKNIVHFSLVFVPCVQCDQIKIAKCL